MTPRIWIRAVAVLAAVALQAGALAQDFPSKPIRIIVPYPAGGQSDIFTRLIADAMRQQLNMPVNVENRAGAGTTLGANVVAKSPPDGYTLLLAAASATAITPLTIKSTAFDPKTITPITLIAKVPYVLVAAKDFPPNTVGELIAYAKANPGKINWATHGMGAAQHLTGEMFAQAAGIKITAIHYQGSTPGVVDMLGGRVELMFDGAGTGLANVRAGKLKALGMGSDKRVPSEPNLATWKESGVPLSAYTWYGLFAPTGTPMPVLEKLHAAITEAIQSAPYKARMAQAEGEIPQMSIAETRRFIAEDTAMWQALIPALNLKLGE